MTWMLVTFDDFHDIFKDGTKCCVSFSKKIMIFFHEKLKISIFLKLVRKQPRDVLGPPGVSLRAWGGRNSTQDDTTTTHRTGVDLASCDNCTKSFYRNRIV